MIDPFPNTARFVRSLRRRLFWVRLAERVGLCIVAVSIIAVLLVPLLMLSGQSALPFSMASLTGAMIAGFAWGLSRRPTALEAAMLADGQLHLHDLIGTAVLVTADARQPSDAWQKTVLALADARCQKLSPSDVLFHRWGGRAWGSTGLLVALELTLAMLSVNPASTTARQPAADAHRISPLLQTLQSPSDQVIGPSAPFAPRPFRAGADNDETPRSALAEGGQDASQSAGQPSDRAASTPPGNAAAADAPGNGAATGRQVKPLTLITPGDAQPNAAGNATPGSAVGGGAVGRLNSNDTRPDGHTGSTGGLAGSASRVAPWQSSAWQSDVRRAQSEVRDRHLPDTYRGLISDYFREE